MLLFGNIRQWQAEGAAGNEKSVAELSSTTLLIVTRQPQIGLIVTKALGSFRSTAREANNVAFVSVATIDTVGERRTS